MLRIRVRKAMDKVLNVFDTYEEIAEGFIYWRTRPWSIARFGGRSIILDLGAGLCTNGVYAYKFGGRYLLCLDLSYRMNLFSRRTLDRERVLGDSIAGDMLFLPLKDESIDSIIAIASLHHIPRKLMPLVIREIMRIARGGAIIIITIWSWRQPRFILLSIPNIFLKIFGLVESLREYRVKWKKRKSVYYRYYYLYTLDEVTKLCIRYGLKILSYGYIGYIKKKNNNIYIVAKAVKQY